MQLRFFVGLVALSLPYLLAVYVYGESQQLSEIFVYAPFKYYDSDGNFLQFPSEDVLNRKVRSVELPATCLVPKVINFSYVNCNVYPSKLECTQICAYGRTLKEGILRKMRCDVEENQWEPVKEWEDCEPFIDCGLTLQGEGKFSCILDYMSKRSHCDITCLQKRTRGPSKNHQCMIDGSFKPSLPDCVKAGTGLKLVDPPDGQKSVVD